MLSNFKGYKHYVSGSTGCLAFTKFSEHYLVENFGCEQTNLDFPCQGLFGQLSVGKSAPISPSCQFAVLVSVAFIFWCRHQLATQFYKHLFNNWVGIAQRFGNGLLNPVSFILTLTYSCRALSHDVIHWYSSRGFFCHFWGYRVVAHVLNSVA